jgi:hypothetical protein
VLTALQYPQITPAFFLSAEFSEGVGSTNVYAWTGNGSYITLGNTYSGIGSVLSISAIETGADGSNGITARNVTVTVSGLDPILATSAQTQFLQGGALTISLALFDATGAILSDPVIIFGGQLDQATLSGDGRQSTITFNVENRLVDLNRSRERLYTPSDVHIEHPADAAFNFVYDLSQTPIYFGSTPAQINNAVAG